MPRCRKKGIVDTGVLNKIIYDDTGLIVLRVHADTAYLVEY